MSVSRGTVVAAVAEIGKYLELIGDNKFRAQAYERAARSLEQVSEDLEKLVESGRLTEVPNIGKGIAPIIEEIVRTGTSGYLEELRAQFPSGIFELMRVPSLGIKKIRALHEHLGVSSLDDLQQACAAGTLAKVPGFGAKTAASICEALTKAIETPERFLLHEALPLAVRLKDALVDVDGVIRADVAGSVRRRLETVGDIDLVIAAEDPEAALQSIARSPIFEEGIASEKLWRGRISTIPVEIYAAAPADYAWELALATGSSEWLSQQDPKKARARKPRLEMDDPDRVWFESAGIAWVEPELRELESIGRKAPELLIRREDLRGTFHAHTTWSDGRHSVEEMAAAAADRGLEYLGFSDHSRSAAYAGGLTEDRMRLQKREIESVARKMPLRIFRGSEVDILADGALDYDEATLAELDFTVASVHSRFGMDVDQMTERILAAVRNPFTTFLGHLSGRKLLVRDPYRVDYARIFEAAAENGVIVELNGSPQRLDVDWRFIRLGLDAGVTFSINPDAHSTAAIDHLHNGVWNARKGGIEARNVFNTKPLEEVEEYLEHRRARAKKLAGV